MTRYVTLIIYSPKLMLNKKLLFVAVIVVMGMGCRSLTTIAETDLPDYVQAGRSRNFPAEISAGDIVHVATGEKITFSQSVN